MNPAPAVLQTASRTGKMRPVSAPAWSRTGRPPFGGAGEDPLPGACHAVADVGFEPTKALPTVLQTAPFDQLGQSAMGWPAGLEPAYPASQAGASACLASATMRYYVGTAGIEPATHGVWTRCSPAELCALSAPREIRTHNLPVRSRVLYPFDARGARTRRCPDGQDSHPRFCGLTALLAVRSARRTRRGRCWTRTSEPPACHAGALPTELSNRGGDDGT